RYLKSITGRIDDFIETPDGRHLGRIDHIFKGIEGIKEAQVVQDDLNHCTVNIVLASKSTKINETLLQKNFAARTGPLMNITIKTLTRIPRDTKRKFKSDKKINPIIYHTKLTQ